MTEASGGPHHIWLVLRLEGPLMAFGGPAIDQYGVTRDLPAASMVTGLLANALGWHRTEAEAHQSLQDRLVFGSRWEHAKRNALLTDIQNAELQKNDKSWTTTGMVERRGGDSYRAPHRRQREFLTDASVTLVLRLDPPDPAPDLTALARALDYPARPLFIGRKPCLPSRPIHCGTVPGASVWEALSALPRDNEPARDNEPGRDNEPARDDEPGRLLAAWPVGEGPADGPGVDKVIDLADRRNWVSGLHGGQRQVVIGGIEPRGEAS